jgi:short-subunit dehydrogenase
LNTLSQTARAEWEQFGIAVSLVIPGMVATGFHHVMRQGSWGAGRPAAGAPPQAVAAAVLRAVETGDAEVFPSAV